MWVKEGVNSQSPLNNIRTFGVSTVGRKAWKEMRVNVFEERGAANDESAD
jgi:hypothetical protein